MHTCRLVYKDLSLSFDLECEDPIACLAAAKRKAVDICTSLRTLPEYSKLTPAAFEYHIDWKQPQLDLFAGARLAGPVTQIVAGPSVPTLATLAG